MRDLDELESEARRKNAEIIKQAINKEYYKIGDNENQIDSSATNESFLEKPLETETTED